MKIVQNNRDLAYFSNPDMNEGIQATSFYFDEYEEINYDFLEQMISEIACTVFIVLEYKARTISERHYGISSIMKRYGIVGDIVYDSVEVNQAHTNRNAVVKITKSSLQPALKYLFRNFRKTLLALPKINALDIHFPINENSKDDMITGCNDRSIITLCSKCYYCVTVIVGNDGTSCNILSSNSRLGCTNIR
jgi:hypothetical protein